MAERKKKDDFTRTMVPEVPAAAKTNVSKVGTVLGKAHFDAKLAQAQAELAAAKAQLAAANKALANLQKPAAASRPSAPARPAAKAPARAAVPPSTDDGGEDLQFKVEVPVGTHGSAVREAVKKSKVQPKVIKIDLDGDHASVPAQPCDAGNRLANPAALACGDYLHGELDPEEEAGDNTAEEVTAITSVHQGVVFNLSSYSSSAVAPALRRAAGFGIDFAITVVLSFIIMPTAQVKFWVNFTKDFFQAFSAWLDSPIFKLGYLIETFAQGQVNELSWNLAGLGQVFHSYLPLLDVKSLFIMGIVWVGTTTVALGLWDSTLGQKILHLKVVHVHREHLGWPTALLRQGVYFPLAVISVVGIVMGFLGSKRCWHDYLAGCKVTLY